MFAKEENFKSGQYLNHRVILVSTMSDILEEATIFFIKPPDTMLAQYNVW